MKMITLMFLLNSMISTCLNHPISLGSILMIQSILSSLFTILLTKNSWYSMILFITFSSGVMIMFMYMSSISSNEKFFSSIKISLLIYLTLMIMILIYKDKLLLFKTKWSEMNLMIEENEEKKSIFKMLSLNKFFLTMILTIMILLTLISVSNLVNSFEGPLKQTYVK